MALGATLVAQDPLLFAPMGFTTGASRASPRSAATFASADVALQSAAVQPAAAEPNARDPLVSTTRILIRHLLVPLDGSPTAERALPYVHAFTLGNGAKVTLLRVLESGGAVDPVEWEIARRQACTYLEETRNGLSTSGIDVQLEVLQGKPAEQILHVAATHGIDLTVLTSHGENGPSQWPLSSNTQKVLSRVPTSLLIIPGRPSPAFPDGPLKIRKLLLALDCSRRAECVLPTAIELARAHEAHLVLAHVVAEPELPRRLSPSAHDLELARALTERNTEEAKRYLDDLQGRLKQVTERTDVRTVVSSRSAAALRELADQEHVDLVLIAAHGFTGDARTTYGSVAAQLLHDAAVPLMVVQDLDVQRDAPQAEPAPVRAP